MEITLKFSLDSFRQLELADILINIWSYGDHIKEKNCVICNNYRNWCITAAKEKWSQTFVDFDFAMQNLIMMDIISPETKNKIYSYIKK